MGGTCGTYREKRNVYSVLMTKSEGDRPIGRPNHRWDNNIKTDFKELKLEGVDWIKLAQDGTCAGLL